MQSEQQFGRRPVRSSRRMQFVYALRDALQESKVMGIPLARLIYSEIVLLYEQGFYTAPRSRVRSLAPAHLIFFALIRTPARWGLSLARSLFSQDTVAPNRVAMHVLSAEARLAGFWVPVAQTLGPGRVVLLTKDRRSVPNDMSAFKPAVYRDFRFSYLQFIVNSARTVKSSLRPIRRAVQECKLRCGTEWLVLDLIVGGILELVVNMSALEILRPSAVVLAYDQGFGTGGALALTAASLGIPTLTFVHGAFGKHTVQGYSPVNAQYVLVWGEYQRELLLQTGISEDRVLVAGYPRLNALEPASRLRNSFVHSLSNRCAIMVGLTTIAPRYMEPWQSALLDLKSRLPEFELVCRIHPSQRKGQFERLLRAGSGLRVMESSEMSMYDCISASAAVVVHTSSLALDVLLLERPLFVYDVYDSEVADVSFDVVEYGAAVYAKSAQEMADRIREYLGNPGKRDELIARGREFAEKYVSYTGREAVENMARDILDHARVQS